MPNHQELPPMTPSTLRWMFIGAFPSALWIFCGAYWFAIPTLRAQGFEQGAPFIEPVVPPVVAGLAVVCFPVAVWLRNSVPKMLAAKRPESEQEALKLIMERILIYVSIAEAPGIVAVAFLMLIGADRLWWGTIVYSGLAAVLLWPKVEAWQAEARQESLFTGPATG